MNVRTNPTQIIQKGLLSLYQGIQGTGILDVLWAQKVFLSSYWFYKRYFEDSFSALVKGSPLLFKGGSILDIGANVGYTAALFSRVVDPLRQVYAFEPEARNLRLLRTAIGRMQLQDRITIVPAAVGAIDQTAELWINPANPADHRILTQAFAGQRPRQESQSIKMIKIDSFLAEHPEASPVAFIKIDVQGYEESVCLGMEQTLLANPKAVIAIEYYPEGILSLGFEPSHLLDFFEQCSYIPHRLSRRGLERLDSSFLRRSLPPPGYIDLLYSHLPL